MKERVFKAVSNTFHPLFSMVWATLMLLLFTPISMIVWQGKAMLLMEVVTYTTLLPVAIIFLLYKLKRVEDMALRNRKDRFIPLLTQILFLVALRLVLQFQGMPDWALRFYSGGILLSVVAFVVSLKWKISGHAMGNAAITAAAFITYCDYPKLLPFAVPIGMLVMTGLVGSIRLYLGRHTLAQVAAGALVGALSMICFV